MSTATSSSSSTPAERQQQTASASPSNSQTHSPHPAMHHDDQPRKKKSGIVWDEENIRLTFHPADKDYGHMKIDEPKTPYEHRIAPDDAEEMPELNLSERSDSESSPAPPAQTHDRSGNQDSFTELHEVGFSSHRANHYKMGEALRRAKELLAQEDDEDDE